MKSHTRKLLSVFIAVLMLAQMLPLATMADTSGDDSVTDITSVFPTGGSLFAKNAYPANYTRSVHVVKQWVVAQTNGKTSIDILYSNGEHGSGGPLEAEIGNGTPGPMDLAPNGTTDMGSFTDVKFTDANGNPVFQSITVTETVGVSGANKYSYWWEWVYTDDPYGFPTGIRVYNVENGLNGGADALHWIENTILVVHILRHGQKP